MNPANDSADQCVPDACDKVDSCLKGDQSADFASKTTRKRSAHSPISADQEKGSSVTHLMSSLANKPKRPIDDSAETGRDLSVKKIRRQMLLDQRGDQSFAQLESYRAMANSGKIVFSPSETEFSPSKTVFSPCINNPFCYIPVVIGIIAIFVYMFFR